MATTQVSFRIDEDVKKSAEKALDEMGLTMSAALTVFLKKVSREKRIPFDVTANDPFYSADNIERLKKSATQMEKTGGTIHEIGALSDNG